MFDGLTDFLGANWLGGLIGFAVLAVVEETIRHFAPKPKSIEQQFAEHRQAIADAAATRVERPPQ